MLALRAPCAQRTKMLALRAPRAQRTKMLTVQNRRGEEIGAAIEAAAAEVEIDPIAVLALIKAESNLNPYAERWGRRTDEAMAAIKENDTARLQEIIKTEWPDISFGYSQRIVKFHDLGTRKKTVENCLAVRNGVFEDPNEDLRAAARRLAGCFQHPSCDGTALSAMVVYNAGSDRRSDPGWLAAWAGNVASYERALQWADEVSALAPARPTEDPSADQLRRGLDIIWGWSERLEVGMLVEPADRAQAAHELRGAAIAVKEAMGLNG